jgi:hypothetical protein
MSVAVIQEIGEIGMSPDEPTPGEVAWRLRAVEQKVDRLESHTAEGFEGLSRQIAALAFVRSDVYAADQRAHDAAMRVLTERIEATDRRAMWAIALVCTVAIGAIITAILGMSGVFGT